LNTLGEREPEIYGSMTLEEINRRLMEKAAKLGADLLIFQSNSEGELIDIIQKNSKEVDGVIINPAALTHYGLSLRDALASLGIPIAEVHISNIYAREDWRHESVMASVVTGQISGFSWRSYLLALEGVVEQIREVSPPPEMP